MKARFFYLLAIILLPSICRAQNTVETFRKKELYQPNLLQQEFKHKIIDHNLSGLWTITDNDQVFGFIGENHQRIRIKIISVTRDPVRKDVYRVYGKSMVKTNICAFKGTLTLKHILRYKITGTGPDNIYKGIKGEYRAVGEYHLEESKGQSHSGIFTGIFKTDFYIDKNDKVQYDDIEKVSDSFNNNEFAGTWTSYDKKITKVCNWGDYRIPNCGDLDSGTGEFSPADKYLPYGWQSIRDRSGSDTTAAKAKKEETRAWWK